MSENKSFYVHAPATEKVRRPTVESLMGHGRNKNANNISEQSNSVMTNKHTVDQHHMHLPN